MGNSGSILPWDDWIYHVNSKKSEVNDLHTQAVSLQNTINASVVHYNALLDQVKILLSGNAALVIIIKTLKFNDLQLKEFDAQLQALPEPPKGVIPAKFGSFIAEITGSFLVLKAVFNLGKLAKSALFAGESAGEVGGEVGLEGLAETGAELGVEAGVEAGIEVGAEIGLEAGLAETGIGIIAAVGLDVIFGAINGAKEASELDSQINSLRDAVNKLQAANDNLNKKFKQLQGVALKEEARFKGLAVALQAIIAYKNAPSWAQLPVDINSIPTYLADQSEALRFYGLLGQLRVTYLRAKERSPKVSKEAIIQAVLLQAKADVTYDQLEALWDVLAKFSSGMRVV